MALKLDITDEKGVKVRYHAIRSFKYTPEKTLEVSLYSYVNQATRDTEKNIVEQNAAAVAYDNNLNQLRAELTKASDEIIADENNADARDRAIKLTDQVNELTLSPDRPYVTEVTDTHYTEDVILLPYIEPLTLDSLYTLLASDGKYKGAESI